MDAHKTLSASVRADESHYLNTARELPYEGAKEMLLVEDVDDRDFLSKLFGAMYEELPEPKKKK